MANPFENWEGQSFFVRNLGGRHGNNNSHVSHWSNHGVAKADLPGASAQHIQAIRLYLLVSKLVNGQSRFGAEDPHWTTKGLEHCQVLDWCRCLFFSVPKFWESRSKQTVWFHVLLKLFGRPSWAMFFVWEIQNLSCARIVGLLCMWIVAGETLHGKSTAQGFITDRDGGYLPQLNNPSRSFSRWWFHVTHVRAKIWATIKFLHGSFAPQSQEFPIRHCLAQEKQWLFAWETYPFFLQNGRTWQPFVQCARSLPCCLLMTCRNPENLVSWLGCSVERWDPRGVPRIIWDIQGLWSGSGAEPFGTLSLRAVSGEHRFFFPLILAWPLVKLTDTCRLEQAIPHD